MEFNDVRKMLEVSAPYKDWRKEHKEYFLAHAFVMLDELNKDIWQIGFFDAKKTVMTTFFIEKHALKVIPDQEVLKSDVAILPLQVDAIKIAVQDALDRATEVFKKECHDPIIRTFFIIQQLPEGAVYNTTFFTQALTTVNVKIDAVDGKVLRFSKGSLADFS